MPTAFKAAPASGAVSQRGIFALSDKGTRFPPAGTLCFLQQEALGGNDAVALFVQQTL